MKTVITILVSILWMTATAQLQNNNWCFSKASLSFDTDPPKSSLLNIFHGLTSTTVSDRHTGKLLFAMGSDSVFNANGVPMKHGKFGLDTAFEISLLNPVYTPYHGKVSQLVVTIPFIRDSSKYYLIYNIQSLVKYNNGRTGRYAFYSVVDMSLDGGLGDVDSSKKHMLVDSSILTEAHEHSCQTTTATGCGCVWYLALGIDSAYIASGLEGTISTDYLYAYKVTDFGIDPKAVVSKLFSKYSNGGLFYPVYNTLAKSISVSADGKKIAIVYHRRVDYTAINESCLKIFDFNNETGVASGGDLIDSFYSLQPSSQHMYRDAEFSEDGTRLYLLDVSVGGVCRVYQYDMTAGSLSAITNSKKKVMEVSYYDVVGNSLQRGQDGHIYIASETQVPSSIDTPYLTRIVNANSNNPVYEITSVPLQPASSGATNILPQPVYYPDMTNAVFASTRRDTTLCLKTTVTLEARKGYDRYTWQDMSRNQSLTINEPGVYWVYMYRGCEYVTDTIVVKDLSVSPLLSVDTSICIGDTILVYADTSLKGARYEWNTGDTTSSVVAERRGWYEVSVSYGVCTGKGGVSVEVYDPIALSLGSDRFICNTGEQIQLPVSATYDGIASYLWQDGSTDNRYTVYGAGEYYVSASNICETVSDTVVYTERNCKLFFPSAFSPNGDGRNDIAHLLGDVGGITRYDMRIVNRWGEVVYHTTDPLQGWDGMYKGQKAELSTYHYLIRYTHLGEEGTMKGDLLLVR